jgi:hypothetical protein
MAWLLNCPWKIKKKLGSIGFLVFDLIFKQVTLLHLKIRKKNVFDLGVLLSFRCGDLVVIKCYWGQY